MTIVLNESGYDTGMSFEDYAVAASQHGDNPADYSTNEDDFAFVSVDYAKQDPNWQDSVTQDWPEDLPIWEYRG